MKTKGMRLLAALALALACAALAACGGGSGRSGPDGGGDASSGDAPIKTAVLLFGRADDQSWNTTLVDSIREVEGQLNLDVIRVVESVTPEAAERAMRDMVAQGAQLIFAHGSGLDVGTKAVAPEETGVCFVQGFGEGKPGPNVVHYFTDYSGAAYLSGMAAAAVSRSGTLGVVGGVDLDEIKQAVGAFEHGARAVDPNVKTLVSWVGEFEDPLRGKEAAVAQIAQGADVVWALGDGTGLGSVEGAKEHGAKIIGAYSDQDPLAPGQVVTGFVNDWSHMIRETVERMRADGPGSCGGKVYVADLANRGTVLAPFHTFARTIPAKTLRAIEDARRAILGGTLDPLTGKAPTS